MKRTILGIAILVMVLMMMMGSVNAANVTAKTEVTKGEMVAVTVNTEKPVLAIEFELTYDTTKFEYVGASAGGLGIPSVTNNTSEGIVTIAIAASDGKTTTQQVTINFRAKETTEEGKFTVSNLVTDVTGEVMTNATTTVKVLEETQKPVEPTEPTNPEKPTEPTEPTTPENKEEKPNHSLTNNQKGEQKVGTDGKVIRKLPQTGAPIYVVVGALVAVISIALVVKKTK